MNWLVISLFAIYFIALIISFVWIEVSRYYENRAEKARINWEIRLAERQLHYLTSKAFSEMLDATRNKPFKENFDDV
jgi:hypothetical protein